MSPLRNTPEEDRAMASRARVLAVGETNVGMKRSHNEDNFVVVDEDRLYVVADGMGGHASGEVSDRDG